MATFLTRSAIVFVAVLASAMFGVFVGDVVFRGIDRGILVPGLAAAVPIFIACSTFARKLRWNYPALIASILPTEAILALVVCSIMGGSITDRFALEHFMLLSLFVVVPWLAGVLTSAIIDASRSKSIGPDAGPTPGAGQEIDPRS